MANDAGPPEPGPSLEPPDETESTSPGPAPGPPDDWFVLLGRIDQEVRRLEDHRQAWRNFFGTGLSGASGGSNAPRGLAGSGEPDWLANLYFRSQALGVRRMVDGDRRAGSFKRLLHKMTEDCVRLTRDWFVESAAARADAIPADDGENASGPAPAAEDPGTRFTRFADPWGSGHLDSEVPRADLRTLESSCNGIKRYVDQYVTHAQLDPDATAPDPADVEAAIDVLLSLLAKYTLLLRPEAPGTAASDSVV